MRFLTVFLAVRRSLSKALSLVMLLISLTRYIEIKATGVSDVRMTIKIRNTLKDLLILVSFDIFWVMLH